MAIKKLTYVVIGVFWAAIQGTPLWAQTTKKQGSKPTKIKSNVEYTTSSGLKYKLIKQGTGAQAQAGQVVYVHYTGTLTNGTKFDSSKDRNEPLKFKLGTGQVIKGWDEGIALLREGDIAILTIPPGLGYGTQDMGTIPPNSTLIFEVELVKVEEGVKPFVVEGKDTITTASGLKYIMVQKAKDKVKPQPRDIVTVNYTGYFLDGRVFDSSIDRGQPLQLPIGAGRVIKGWDEGILLLAKGEKARLIIPPHLAYGEQGAGNGAIPPNSTLIFDVELLDIKEGTKPFDITGKDTQTTASGLQYIIVKKASVNAPKAAKGNSLSVHYTGYFTDGRTFDSSVDRGQPFTLKVGEGNVIKGWDEGLLLMSAGDKIRFIIPPALAYGEQGAGNGIIPPNSTLIFDVELLDIRP